MKFRRIFLIIAGIASLGLLAVPRKEPGARREEAPGNSRTKSDHVRDPDEERWKGFAARAKSIASGDKKQRAEFLKQLAPEDRTKALLTLAGLTVKGKGLPSGVEELMQGLIAAWAAEDFDAAWKGIGKIEDSNVAQRLKGRALEVLGKSDIERACELHLTEAAAGKWFFSEVPHMMLSEKLSTNAGDYVKWMEKLKYPDVGGQDLGKFGKDFNFQLAADHAAAQTAIDGIPNKSLPVNFLHEWAKEDPEAAFNWWSSNELAYSSLNSIAEALEKQSPGSATGWLAARLPESGPLREKFFADFAKATHWQDFKLEAIAGALPSQQAGDVFLTDYLMATAANETPYYPAIGSMSSPEARLDAFRALGAVNPKLGIDKIPDTRLQEWGVSRAQLEQIFFQPVKE